MEITVYLGCKRGGQGTSSNSSIPYPLDKYSSPRICYVGTRIFC